MKGNVSTDKFNLSHNCRRSNLVIEPKKGTALLWYNHFLNETDGWLGGLDPYTLHGGCDVIKGEKWLANMWIPAGHGWGKQFPSTYLNWKDLYFAELNAKS